MVSPKDLGWVGMLKALVQAGLALGAVGIVLSWPKEFGTAASLGGLFVALAGAFATVEWLTRSWYEEQVKRIQRGEEAVEDEIRRGVAAADARAKGLDQCLTIANARLKSAEREPVMLNGSSNLPDIASLTPAEREKLKA